MRQLKVKQESSIFLTRVCVESSEMELAVVPGCTRKEISYVIVHRRTIAGNKTWTHTYNKTSINNTEMRYRRSGVSEGNQ
ncbi:hypothetical protein DPEC_G00357260 [Dallia pectoralis]|uniref:Uncharacterized protein n=1 Tax=Dallia pectoralis TaxID=75939 RepID=A0ACC2F059_DALPE|nr:hypothetical protein DPEC_G00357260 [Dallia pectoralis]